MKKHFEQTFEVINDGKTVTSFQQLSPAFAYAKQHSIWSGKIEVDVCIRMGYDFNFVKLAEFNAGKQTYSRKEYF